MNNLLNQINLIYLRKEKIDIIIKQIQPTLLKETLSIIIKAKDDMLDQKYKTCSDMKAPYFVLLENEPIKTPFHTDIKNKIDVIKSAMTIGSKWYIPSHYMEYLLGKLKIKQNSATLTNITTYLEKYYPTVIKNNYTIQCNSEILNKLTNVPETISSEIKEWQLILVEKKEYDNGTSEYKHLKIVDISPVVSAINPIPPSIDTSNISSGNIRTIKWFLQEKTNFNKPFNMNITGNLVTSSTISFYNTSPSLNGKTYNEFNKTVIGTGYNAAVACCLLIGGQDYIMKLPKLNNPAKASIYIECMVANDLNEIQFPIVKIEDAGKNYEFIIRKKLDSGLFGDKISQLTLDQITSLKDIFNKSNQYAIITGVPLDLKPDNLWWDNQNNKWLLVDTGPRLDGGSNFYAFTLNPSGFSQYYQTYWIGKGGEGSLTQKYKFNGNQIYDSFNESLSILDNNVDYQQKYKELTAQLKDSIIKNNDNKYLINKGILINNDILDFLERNKYPITLLGNNHNILLDLSQNNYMVNIYNYINTDIVSEHVEKQVLAEFNKFKDQINAIYSLVKDSIAFIHNNTVPLTENDKDALKNYTGSEFVPINSCLRDSEKDFPTGCQINYQNKIKTLSELYQRPNIPKTKGEIIVYRSVGQMGNVQSSDFFGKMAIGSIFEDRTFMSTSLKFGIFLIPSKVILKITLPQNTPCLYIDTISTVPEEKEVLLPAGYAMTLKNKSNIMYENYNYNMYEFTCSFCELDKRYSVSDPPQNLSVTNPRLKSQPQDKTVDKMRLDLPYLKYYNKIIPKDTNTNLRLLTWNIYEWRGLHGTNSNIGVKNNILQVIEKLEPDFIGLQEVSFPQNIVNIGVDETMKLNSIFTGTKYKTAAICKADPGFHAQLHNALMYKNEFNLNILPGGNFIELGHKRCACVLETTIKGKKIVIITLHLDVNESQKRIDNIKNLKIKLIDPLLKLNVKNIVIMGDFNSYRKEDYNDTQESQLKSIKSGHGWPDIYEATAELESYGFEESFKKYNQEYPINTNKFGGRIDFIYVYKDWDFGKNVKAYTYYGDASDHIPIIVDFAYN